MIEEHDSPKNSGMLLTQEEAALIAALRSGDRDTATEAIRALIWERIAPMFEADEPSVNNPRYNNPNAPPLAEPAPKRMSKWRLWLLKRGIEFSVSEVGCSYECGINRSLSISVNHRFFGADVIFQIVPFRGVFEDELAFPHAEIAAQYNVTD